MPIALICMLAAGVGFLWLCRATAPHDDFFDSRWWWWGWLLLPAVSALVSYLTPKAVTWSGWLLAGPQAIGVFVEGALQHDPRNGASLWPLGMLLVICLGALSWFTARVTIEIFHRR